MVVKDILSSNELGENNNVIREYNLYKISDKRTKTETRRSPFKTAKAFKILGLDLYDKVYFVGRIPLQERNGSVPREWNGFERIVKRIIQDTERSAIK